MKRVEDRFRKPCNHAWTLHVLGSAVLLCLTCLIYSGIDKAGSASGCRKNCVGWLDEGGGREILKSAA